MGPEDRHGVLGGGHEKIADVSGVGNERVAGVDAGTCAGGWRFEMIGLLDGKAVHRLDDLGCLEA